MNEPLNPIQTAADLTPETGPEKPAPMTNETTETNTENGAISHENAHETVDDFVILSNAKDAPKSTGEPLPVSEKSAFKPAITPFYDVNHDTKELFYCGVTKDKSGWLEPLRLCKAIEIVGRGEDANKKIHCLIQYKNHFGNTLEVMAIRAGLIGTPAGLEMLNDAGLAVSASRAAKEYLSDFLQNEGALDSYILASKGGWNHGAYVLPSSEVLGNPEKPLFYIGDKSHAAAYSQAGTVVSWRNSVGRLSQGNSRAMFGIAGYLAAPLLDLMNQESGGFHLWGKSGDGKTTSIKAGASIWGNPDLLMQAWRATDLALTNEAAAFNDGCLFLDEIQEAKVETVNASLYSLASGVGKGQGATGVGNRVKSRWRVMLLSTGEPTAADYAASEGKPIKAGQMTRLVDIEANAGAGFGAFDCLHGYQSAGAFAEALTVAYTENNGTVGREFVGLVSQNRIKVLACAKAREKEWLDTLPADEAGQKRRPTKRFALLATALELATEWGFTGWQAGEGEAAIRRIWADWLKQVGSGRHEDRAAIEQVMGILQASEMRFEKAPIDEKNRPIIPNKLGFRRYEAQDVVYLVFPAPFKLELLKGHNLRHACKALHDAGILERPTGRDEWQVNGGKDIGQVYRLRAKRGDGREEGT